MTVTTYWFVIATGLTAILASIAIWSPRTLKLKVLALLAAAAFLPVGYLTMNDILSRPKPASFEIVHNQVEEVRVISSLLKEDEAIYLWLQIPEVSEPRAYQLPWSDETARELHKAQQEAEQSGTEVKMNQPFEKTVDNQQPVFYAQPPPPPPEKEYSEADKPLLFNAANNDQ